MNHNIYESASGVFFGYLIAVAILIWVAMDGRRRFAQSASHQILIASVAFRIVLFLLSQLEVVAPIGDDLWWFHLDAVALSEGRMSYEWLLGGAKNFSNMTSFFYMFLGPSYIIFYAICLVAHVVGVYYFARLIRALDTSEGEPLAVACFCFAPSSLLYNNYNARETFMIMFMTICLTLLVEFRRSVNPWTGAAAALAGYGFAVFHNRYLIVVPLVIGTAVALPRFFSSAKGSRARETFAMILFGTVICGVLGIVVSRFGFAQTLADDGLINHVYKDNMRGLDIQARTQLPFSLLDPTPAQFMASLPILYLQAMFAPIVPWVASQAQDAIAIVDTAIRSVFFFYSIKYVLDESRGERRDVAVMLLAIYTIFVIVSSLGTTTVGTMMRHQFKMSWILFAIGAAGAQRLLVDLGWLRSARPQRLVGRGRAY